MDPATAALLAQIASQIVGSFSGSKPDPADNYTFWQQRSQREESRQATSLSNYLRQTFGDRVAMVMLEKLGMETANKQAEFDLGQDKESWGMGKELYGRAGELSELPAFDPNQNIGNVSRAIEPEMKRMESSFAKRGMSGGGPEWAGLANMQSGALSKYLLGANERSFYGDRDWKKNMMGFQSSLL